jgi:ADP-ribose pyrophosphatase
MRVEFKGDNFSVSIVSRQVRSVWQNFEVVIRPEIALCIPIDSTGQILLVRQFRAAVNSVVLEFPAGRVSPAEDPEQAAQRELIEEIGFRARTVDKLGTFLTAPHFSDELVNVYVTRGDIVTLPAPTPKEDFREIVSVRLSEIDRLIKEGSLCDAKSITAHAMARLSGGHLGTSI